MKIETSEVGEIRFVGYDEDGYIVVACDLDDGQEISRVVDDDQAQKAARHLFGRVRVTTIIEMLDEDDEVASDLADVLDDEVP